MTLAATRPHSDVSGLGNAAIGVTVVIPTRNERECLPDLLTRLTAAVAAIPADVEVLFVDDSDDETPQLISELAPPSLCARVLHRSRSERNGGLGGALLGGFAAARGEVVAVMDADLQHPPEMLPELVVPLLNGERERRDRQPVRTWRNGERTEQPLAPLRVGRVTTSRPRALSSDPRPERPGRGPVRVPPQRHR